MRASGLLICLARVISLSIGFGVAEAGTVTIQTGGEFTATAAACIPILSIFQCPTQGLMLAVNVMPPTSAVSGFGIEASLISDVTGEVVLIGNNFPFWISTYYTGELMGIFGYNGLLDGFPFPVNSGFFGANPATATFSVRFRNTGFPFTFWESPERSIVINLDSGNYRTYVATNSVTLAPVPEPVPLWVTGVGLVSLLALPRGRKLPQLRALHNRRHSSRPADSRSIGAMSGVAHPPLALISSDRKTPTGSE
jgi:hypothetical protein